MAMIRAVVLNVEEEKERKKREEFKDGGKNKNPGLAVGRPLIGRSSFNSGFGHAQVSSTSSFQLQLPLSRSRYLSLFLTPDAIFTACLPARSFYLILSNLRPPPHDHRAFLFRSLGSCLDGERKSVDSPRHVRYACLLIPLLHR